MPPLKLARIAAVVSTVAALAAIAGAVLGSQSLVVVAATVCGAAGLTGYRATAPRRPAPERTAGPAEGSFLVATLKNLENGSQRVASDLQRILVGIVADERGAIDRAEAQTLVASFSKSDHAGAAVHAAQRMLSNVDAVSRRLQHDLRIAIAVHSGPRGDETLGIATRVQDAASNSVPVLVSEPAARHLPGQLERVETLAGEGWTMDVFSFLPAQRRLPGL